MMDNRLAFAEQEESEEFIRRHIGPGPEDQAVMLKALGYENLGALIDAAVPAKIRIKEPLDLPPAQTESAVLQKLRQYANTNTVNRTLIGMGYYGTRVPAVIQRNILENPAWYTAYTPYQPEISQGRLEMLLNFQTMIGDLTGLEIANASLLDEGTAAAEAMAFCHKASKNKGNVFFVSKNCHPQTIDILQTRAAPAGLTVMVGDENEPLPEDAFAVLLQYPDTNGAVHDYAAIVEKAHAQGALAVVAADLLALTHLTPPGEFGADVAIGTSQRFGVPLGFGGPHAAYFATKDEYKRSIPGRIVGVSVDKNGDPAYRLALQTREQHIRREKATSNICTAQVLLAVMAAAYACYHGPDGLTKIGRRVHRRTAILAQGLRELGYTIAHDNFFDTIIVQTDDWTGSVTEAARIEGVNLRIFENSVGISLDETCTRELVERLWAMMAFDSMKELTYEAVADRTPDAIPAKLERSSEFLTHPAFNQYHSETEMLRYLRRLADKDVALDRSMIPLGSCTMKLNATTEMIPVTWASFSDIHPFAPRDQVEGYHLMISELERMLAEITGYAAVSLQPNAGSQGEYAGLLVISAYHASRGEGHRNICLIPSSAHGTNPASAAMAGMKVVVVKCDDDGNVDMADLKAKVEQHSSNLAALMITYPSTHGVFEETVTEICDLIHEHGGQVYMDGANLNAMVGVCKPGQFGSDVSHLNLHKTFCIPHGGGGPGVGPIGVGAHLAPFLPGHRNMNAQETAIGPVSAAPYGSAGILPISWSYIELMGANGLKKATEVAILSANYLAQRLEEHFPVLYKGKNGLVAHECIIDLRPLKDETGVTVDDVAKRLMDYGFHAPTMSFPVPGTLMIEPTESEPLAELERFCAAMIAIRQEIRDIEEGKLTRDESPLAHAPHTAGDLMADDWDRKYSRAQGAFPVDSLRSNKYWPPVARIDQAYGDKHLICSCPPIEAYQDAAE
ncbi:aminomethyl-transferring glycine dehydrogenase [Nisaea nitritireducens]|uniref:aminomethyl-transferring glycine dehydrogenase n=1 Tax=Nisaea nitritireducens TaxID=568392 RepID=UPI001867E2A0|nr:aminomethyl-transferring glycine dehydrogenase [Nisaea nitritireducens]